MGEGARTIIEWLFGTVDWRELLLPTLSPVEIIVRGSLVYLGTFVLLRLIVKREFAGLGISDLIVIVFIADAAQNAMSGAYRSVPDGLLLVAVLMSWAYVLDRLAFKYRWFERVLKPRPLQLIKDGRTVEENMRREFITEEELRESVRQMGIEDISQVKAAWVESDGSISAISSDGKTTRSRARWKPHRR